MRKTFAAACGALLIAFFATNAGLAQTGGAPSIADRLSAAAQENRQRLDFDGASFSGPAWETLLREGDKAQFFMLGEEHGIAENPKLAAALFAALVPSGYAKAAIEISPPAAFELDRAARGGVEGLKTLMSEPGASPAFFGMKEEAEWLAAARAAVKGSKSVLWGCDYEVGADRLLLRRLEEARKPEAATDALRALKQASDASWAKYNETHDPQYIYSFAGDPALVRAVRDAWPKRDADVSWILDTLEETFEINRLWGERRGYDSNARRSAFMRANFLKYWRAEKAAGRSPKVFMKFGASHIVRGRSMTEVFDLGALVPEIAAMDGKTAFRLLVLPGAGTQIAALNPATWTYTPVSYEGEDVAGLAPITREAYPDAFTLIDLRPLRAILSRQRADTDPELMRVVHGYDAILVLSGSTPSSNL